MKACSTAVARESLLAKRAESQTFVSPNAPILLSFFRILHIFYRIKAVFSLFLFTFARKDLQRL